MEDPIAKDQSSASGSRSASRLLRYPLRSSFKKEKPPAIDTSNSSSASTTKRGKSALSSVSKSVSVLDMSGKSKEKSAKPPRRLSVPSKSNNGPASGIITPISEARLKRNAGSDTPLSDVSKSSSRRKFSVLSSASYWLSQIKLSESAAKHSISLGFFKLAYDAGCEPLHKVGDELKSYLRRHDLSDFGDTVNQLFESYKISGNSEKSVVTSNDSTARNEDNQSSDIDVNSSTSVILDAENLKPKPLDENVHEIQQENKSKKEVNEPMKKVTRITACKNDETHKSISDVKGKNTQKKPVKTAKKDLAAQDMKKTKNRAKISAQEEGRIKSPPDEALQENKENMAAPEMEETALTTEA